MHFVCLLFDRRFLRLIRFSTPLNTVALPIEALLNLTRHNERKVAAIPDATIALRARTTDTHFIFDDGRRDSKDKGRQA